MAYITLILLKFRVFDMKVSSCFMLIPDYWLIGSFNKLVFVDLKLLVCRKNDLLILWI